MLIYHEIYHDIPSMLVIFLKISLLVLLANRWLVSWFSHSHDKKSLSLSIKYPPYGPPKQWFARGVFNLQGDSGGITNTFLGADQPKIVMAKNSNCRCCRCCRWISAFSCRGLRLLSNSLRTIGLKLKLL